MAVGADWPQIGFRIYFPSASCLRQLLQVVHMNESCTNRAVSFFKVETADRTCSAEYVNTLSSCSGVSLYSAHLNRSTCSLGHLAVAFL